MAQRQDEQINTHAQRALDDELQKNLMWDFSEWYTLKEAALVCNSTPQKIYYSVAVARNKLPGVQRGRFWFVRRADVLAYAIVLLERRARAAGNSRQAENLRRIRTADSNIRAIR
jgi:hypothetical protein